MLPLAVCKRIASMGFCEGFLDNLQPGRVSVILSLEKAFALRSTWGGRFLTAKR